MELHPQIIGKKGKKEFVVLPYDEFLRVQNVLEDVKDLKDLRDAKKKSASEESIPLSLIKNGLLTE